MRKIKWQNHQSRGYKKRVSEYYIELYENNEIKEGYEKYHEEQERFIKNAGATKMKMNKN